MFINTVKQTICAAHTIEGHSGRCSRLHGHNWIIDIVVESETLDHLGIAMDFSDIKALSTPLFDELDHSFLNDLPYFKKHPPSSENLACYIYNSLEKIFEERGVHLKTINVWETPEYCSTYERNKKKS